MSAGHTPGPHFVCGVNTLTEVGGFRLVWSDNELLAYVAKPADAVLYAAAPDLLEAAAVALNFIENTESEFGETLRSGDALRAAIVKATAA